MSFLNDLFKSKAQQNSSQDSSFLDDTTLIDINIHKKGSFIQYFL